MVSMENATACASATWILLPTESQFYWTKGQWTKGQFHELRQPRILQFVKSVTEQYPVKKRSDLKEILLGTLAVVLFALAGCSARSVDLATEPPRCELNANAVCASAIENYLTAEAVRLAQAAPSKSPHLVPLVAPVSLPGGELAAEVDCYVNVDPNGSRVVYAHVAIPPESPQAVEHLRNQDLCTDAWPERRLAMDSTLYDR
jgi:hypothetical protein